MEDRRKMEDVGEVLGGIVNDITDRGVTLTIKQVYDAKPHDGTEIYSIDAVDGEGEEIHFLLQGVTDSEYKPCLLILTVTNKKRDFREVTIYDNKKYCWDAIYCDFSSYVNTWNM